MEFYLIKFIKMLPERERLSFLLIRSFERDLTSVKSDEHLRELSSLYEEEIKRSLTLHQSPPVYLNGLVPPDNADPSTVESHSCVCTAKKLSKVAPRAFAQSHSKSKLAAKDDDEFAATMGQWASSFSDEEEEEPLTDKVPADVNG